LFKKSNVEIMKTGSPGLLYERAVGKNWSGSDENTLVFVLVLTNS